MRFMMVVIRKGEETAAADAAPGGQDDGVQKEPAESGRTARVRWASPAFDRSACFNHRGEGNSYRWAVR